MNIRETTLRADRVKAQCETCPLNRMEAGVVVRIKKLCASPEIQTRLREIGFCEEQIIRLVTTQTNYICLVCNTRLALSCKLAELILVEPLQAFELAPDRGLSQRAERGQPCPRILHRKFQFALDTAVRAPFATKAWVTISTGCRNCDAGWPANLYQFLLKCVCTSSQLSGRKRFPSTRVKLSGIWHSSCLTWRAMLRTKYRQPRNRSAWLVARKAFHGTYAR